MRLFAVALLAVVCLTAGCSVTPTGNGCFRVTREADAGSYFVIYCVRWVS